MPTLGTNLLRRMRCNLEGALDASPLLFLGEAIALRNGGVDRMYTAVVLEQDGTRGALETHTATILEEIAGMADFTNTEAL